MRTLISVTKMPVLLLFMWMTVPVKRMPTQPMRKQMRSLQDSPRGDFTPFQNPEFVY